MSQSFSLAIDSNSEYSSESVIFDTDTNIGHWFEIIEEDSLNLQAQITDNYIENNTSIQDHIAISPVIITMRGYIGETVYHAPTSYGNIVDSFNDFLINKFGFSVSDKLTPISALLPPLSNVNQIARNAVNYVESSVNRYQKIYNQFKNLKKADRVTVSETVQKYAARHLKNMWENRTLVEVVTPYGYYNNMAIQSITLTQGNSISISELSVTLKQINYAETTTTDVNKDVISAYNAIPRAEEVNCGKAQGVNDYTILGSMNKKFAKSKYEVNS